MANPKADCAVISSPGSAAMVAGHRDGRPDDRHRHAHHQDVAQHLLPGDAAPAQRRGHQDVHAAALLSPARVADSARIDHRPVTSGRKPPYLYWM